MMWPFAAMAGEGIITKLTVYVRDTSGEIAPRKLSMRCYWASEVS